MDEDRSLIQARCMRVEGFETEAFSPRRGEKLREAENKFLSFRKK